MHCADKEHAAKLGDCGKLGPDASIIQDGDAVLLRAGKCGGAGGAGRSYRVQFIVTDSEGQRCGGSTLVTVGADSSYRPFAAQGKLYDSTQSNICIDAKQAQEV